MSATDDKFYRARITHRSDIAADLWIIRVAPGGAFRFQSGQYATLGAQGPEKLIERAYSIVSAPHERELEIFIELVRSRRRERPKRNGPRGHSLTRRAEYD